MTSRVLVAYATKHGSTEEVARAIADRLSESFDVDLRPAVGVKDVAGYSGVVLGGAIYAGRWHREARRFLKRRAKALGAVPLAVFGMGPKTLKDPDLASARAQLDRALAATPEVRPVSVAIFGGVIDPAKLGFPFNRLPAVDLRDWGAIEAWAGEVGEVFGAPAGPAFDSLLSPV
jgi:menaquinone-dependent protoporphyrinogen oxidase